MLIPYRDDNPTSSAPIVTISLILLNIVIFFYYRFWVANSEAEFYGVLANVGLIPRQFFSRHLIIGWHGIPTPLRLFTAMFMHGGLLHLGGNMLYLWIFGNNVEDYFGHAKFLLFYLGAGLGASMAFLLTNPTATSPMVGASGAIAGVLGAYLILYPHAKVHVLLFLLFFFTTITLPAGFILSFWIVIQIINGLGDFGVQTSGVAWFAHIGGFFCGIILLKTIPGRRKLYRRTLIKI